MNVTSAPQRHEHHPGPVYPGHHEKHCCIAEPAFDHLAYRYGQLLTPSHLQRAQQSVYDKLKLHNRCLHGWGVICGLEVGAVPMPEDCPPEPEPHEPPEQTQQKGKPYGHRGPAAEKHPEHGRWKEPCDIPKTEIWVECGMAVDCEGHDLVVRDRIKVDLYGAMSPADRKIVDDDRVHTLWVSLCYRSYGVDRVRTAYPNDCDGGTDAFYAFQREGVCVRVTVEEPEQRDLCETCCTCCASDCVVLARLDGYCRGHRPGEVDNSVRRPLSTYVPTVILGIGWHHGAVYSHDDVDDLLWHHGLKVRFSRPVHADTITEGVCDVYIHSRHNQDLWVLDGDIELGTEHSPGMVSSFVYRGDEHHQENIDARDRILFALRTDFILDHCCRPVDGNHVGGLVPALPGDYPMPESYRREIQCASWPHRLAPWTSGNQVPGSTFESWFTTAGLQDERSTSRRRGSA